MDEAVTQIETLANILVGFAGRLTPAAPPLAPARLLPLRLTADPLPAVTDLDMVEATPDMSRHRLAGNDVVLAARGPFRVAIAPPSYEGVILGANLIALRTQGIFQPRLLAAFLALPAVQTQLYAGTRGAATAGFTVKSLRAIRLRLGNSDTLFDLDRALAEANRYRTESLRAIDSYERALAALVERACLP
jgi:hypothetical protein